MFDAGVIVSVDRNSWCSPEEIRDALLRLWPDGPDLDPCSNERSIIPCRRRYTIEDCVDIVDQVWRPDERVYCNPRFDDTGPWAARMSMHSGGVVGCVLCDPSVSWWSHIWTATAICFPDHRVKFIPPPGVKPSSFSRPIALPFWMPDGPLGGAYEEEQRDAFDAAFSPLGKVVHL